MKGFSYTVVVLLLAEGLTQAYQPTTESGKQLIIARQTRKPFTIYGVFSPGEWSAATPIHVDAIRPTDAPGLVPAGINPPNNQDDSSYTIYAMYDAHNLYIAVDVADDNVIADNPDNPWLDDDVEIFIDGDNQPFDMDAINFIPDWFGVLPNNEGFQLVTSAGNVAKVYPSPVIQVDWSSRAGMRPRGFLVETRISLNSINTIDNSWWTNPNAIPPALDADGNPIGDPTQPSIPGAVFSPSFRRPQPGDSIGFNIAVADDDSGRSGDDPFNDSYNRTDLNPNPSSYTAWDGSSANWYYADEAAWGTLYFAP